MINYSLNFSQPSVVVPINFINLQLTATRNSTVITVRVTFRTTPNAINTLQGLVGNTFSLTASTPTTSKELIFFCNPLLRQVTVTDFLNAGQTVVLEVSGVGVKI